MDKKQLSISQLKSYMQCQEMYRLHYIEKIKEPLVGSALVLGSAVHHTIDEWFKSKGTITPSSFLRNDYDKEMAGYKKKGQEIDYGEWSNYEKDIKSGIEMVERYFSTMDGIVDNESFGEVKFYLELPEMEDAFIYGVIDRIINRDGIRLKEYKTTKKHPEPWFMDNDPQLACYAYAMKYGRPVHEVWNLRTNTELSHLFGNYPESVDYVALYSQVKSKKPWEVKILNHPYKITQNKMDQFPFIINNIWKSIKLARDNNCWIKNNYSLSGPCGMCGYRNLCWKEEPKITLQEAINKLGPQPTISTDNPIINDFFRTINKEKK